MKFLLTIAAVTLLSLPVYAGEECEGQCPLGGQACESCTDSLDGFSCDNHCPMAKHANTHRSTGLEALAVSKAMRDTAAKTLARNLAQI